MLQKTKKVIMEAFLELIREQTLDKISVKDIVEASGINRNTFYYYYKDLYDLIDDVFLTKTKQVLTRQQQYDTWLEEFREMSSFLIEHRQSISHIYYSKSRDVLERYIFTISGEMIRSYIEKLPESEEVCEEDRNFVCSFYSFSMVGMMLSWLKGDMQVETEEFLGKMAAIFEDTIREALKKR